MKRSFLAGAAALLVAAPVLSQVRPDVIYGDDDRLDMHQVRSEKLKSMAKSTVALFKASGVKVDEEAGTAELTTSSYGENYNLCEDEPFRDQRSGAFCSGSLVGPDLVMTAGHCVRSAESCQQTKFVFGFGISDKEAGTPGSVPSGEVYGCAELLGQEEVGTGADWALIKLDRAVANHSPLKISRNGNPKSGTPLVVIGHPAGLPTKVAGGASVRESDKGGYFTANLDTYGGNSGSAVFNAITGEIEGILVRGENDYVYDSAGQCRRSNVCTADGCRGEDVTQVGVLASMIPKSGPGAALAKPGPAFSTLLKLAEPTR